MLSQGQSYISNVHLRHTGLFKSDLKKGWMTISGEEYFSAKHPGFVWKGKTAMFTARDMFINGKGRLVVSSVLNNVMLPALRLGHRPVSEIKERAYAKLSALDMEQSAHKRPNQLSGGQKQRVAIARAMINDPLVIMGDEPTGNLDKRNSEIVFDIFLNLCQSQGQTLLIVTHDQQFAGRTGRIVEMEDGRIV